MTWVLDLDGVVWRGEQPIDGSAAAVGRLRDRGESILLVTNNSALKVAEYLAKLDRCGLPTEPGELITSAQVAAGLLHPGQTALVCAGPGVNEALEARGVRCVRTRREAGADPVAAVVVGWHRDFDYERLTEATDAVRAGASLIGTNDDATYPTPTGVLPGGGAILAAVAYASGTEPTVAGKPYPPMVDAVRGRVTAPVVMVGDRPSTDGLLARRLGATYGLVLTGVTSRRDLPVDPEPDHVADDLASLVDELSR